MIVVYVPSDKTEEWNCSEHRCVHPAQALASIGHITRIIKIGNFAVNDEVAKNACKDADLIVLERSAMGPTIDSIRYWKDKGKVVILDFDDAYDHMDATNGSYIYWGRGLMPLPGGRTVIVEPHPIEQFKLGLRLVHAATVPSHVLVEDWKNYTGVYYLPNYLDWDQFKDLQLEEHEGLVIGWGGSASHLRSFLGSGVAHALKRIFRKRKDVRLALNTVDPRVYAAISIPEDRKTLYPWVPYSDWPKQMLGWDLALAPLHGAYDDRRSGIKVEEYAADGLPWVATDAPPYWDWRDVGTLTKNGPANWEKAINNCLDDLPNLKEKARKIGRPFAESFSLDNNAERIVRVYQTIIEKAKRG